MDRTFPDHIRVILLTRKNSKAINHFKLRKYPVLYLDNLKPRDIYSMVDDYVNSDFADQINKKRLEVMTQLNFLDGKK
jgi:hypothetical protein